LSAQEAPVFAIERGLTEHAITYGGKPVARYRWKDGDIRRPFFHHLHAPDGRQVTRNHPPIAGKDATDHDTFHPGLWMSFGDLSGQDYWRNKARVVKEGEGFARGEPFTFSEQLGFYDGDDVEIGRQDNSIAFQHTPLGYLLLWKAHFRAPDRDLVFGDQEEMGLGVRVHTELTVKSGGTIRDSEGRVNEKGVWGKTAKWCAYYRTFKEKDGALHRGVVLFADPENFRPSWWHARDYGLLVANAFGKNAFTGGEKSRVVVKKGESLTLRYGVLLFSHTGETPRLEEGYQAFLKALKR
jgi:hypothetical protein